MGTSETAQCECGSEGQTPEHILQSCPCCEDARQEVWPQDTPLHCKLWGPRTPLSTPSSGAPRTPLSTPSSGAQGLPSPHQALRPQDSPLHTKLWGPQDTPLHCKLWGNADDLRRTAKLHDRIRTKELNTTKHIECWRMRNWPMEIRLEAKTASWLLMLSRCGRH